MPSPTSTLFDRLRLVLGKQEPKAPADPLKPMLQSKRGRRMAGRQRINPARQARKQLARETGLRPKALRKAVKRYQREGKLAIEVLKAQAAQEAPDA